MGIALDGKEGPGAYGLNRDVMLTVLVVREDKVAANFALISPNETDAPRIKAAIDEVLKGYAAPLPAGPDELRAEVLRLRDELAAAREEIAALRLKPVPKRGEMERPREDEQLVNLCGRLAQVGGRAGEKGEIRIWEKGKLLRTIEAHADLIYREAWSGDGKSLYTAGGDKRIGVVDVDSGQVEYLEGHTGAVLALAVHGDLLASGGADRTIRVWRGKTLLRTIANHWDSVQALAFSPDGKYLASGSADRTVRIWQPEIGRLVRIVPAHEGTVQDLVWTPTHVVSACSSGKVRFIAPDDVTIEREVPGSGDWVNALCPAGNRLYSGDASGRLTELK